MQRIPRYKLLLEQLLKYTPDQHDEYEYVDASLIVFILSILLLLLLFLLLLENMWDGHIK